MVVVSEMEAGKCQLRVEGDMTIYTAAELKNELISCIGKAQCWELDLSQVNEMDSAGLQLLILLKREAAKRGAQLALTAHSHAVTEVIDTFSMASYFGDPIVLQEQRTV